MCYIKAERKSFICWGFVFLIHGVLFVPLQNTYPVSMLFKKNLICVMLFFCNGYSAVLHFLMEF